MTTRNKVAFAIKNLGLILLILCVGEADNLLDSNTVRILNVSGTALIFIGLLLQKPASK